MKRIILIGMVLMLCLLIGCTDYKALYIDEIEAHLQTQDDCEARIKFIEQPDCPPERVCPGCPVCTEPKGCDYKQFEDEILRYSTTIKGLEYHLSLYNNTEVFEELANNHTNLKWKYEECNETLNTIKEAIE